ncbi:hypothetical protein HMI01_21450 [Halolactibacillus miurensis]|uniref:Uncharacterized protein n=1 Tax=Halolactibacillus miurensis TaxID=306541 RepID=A0ABQ0VVI0_9BACI|nr:hypothetical protein HMI01_21450 [Halolactibacillus miurensis]
MKMWPTDQSNYRVSVKIDSDEMKNIILSMGQKNLNASYYFGFLLC